MKTVLVTGAAGFLGRNASIGFKNKGYRVIGLGYDTWGNENFSVYGIDRWIAAEINAGILESINENLDCIVHCAGSGAVGDSFQNPLNDFTSNVSSTITVLEFMRRSRVQAEFIYPSSTAVYGQVNDHPISEESELKPVSPYGYNKILAEKICEYYSRFYGLHITVIRYFSIYGNGLRKQLLWDACCKLSTGDHEAVFHGTGLETRDWIHIEDAVNLVFAVLDKKNGYSIYNGGAGTRYTNRYIIDILARELGSGVKIQFNGIQKDGDPRHYWSDNSRVNKLNWACRIELEKGLGDYAAWFKEQPRG